MSFSVQEGDIRFQRQRQKRRSSQWLVYFQGSYFFLSSIIGQLQFYSFGSEYYYLGMLFLRKFCLREDCLRKVNFVFFFKFCIRLRLNNEIQDFVGGEEILGLQRVIFCLCSVTAGSEYSVYRRSFRQRFYRIILFYY